MTAFEKYMVSQVENAPEGKRVELLARMLKYECSIGNKMAFDIVSNHGDIFSEEVYKKAAESLINNYYIC